MCEGRREQKLQGPRICNKALRQRLHGSRRIREEKERERVLWIRADRGKERISISAGCKLPLIGIKVPFPKNAAGFFGKAREEECFRVAVARMGAVQSVHALGIVFGREIVQSEDLAGAPRLDPARDGGFIVCGQKAGKGLDDDIARFVAGLIELVVPKFNPDAASCLRALLRIDLRDHPGQGGGQVNHQPHAPAVLER